MSRFALVGNPWWKAALLAATLTLCLATDLVVVESRAAGADPWSRKATTLLRSPSRSDHLDILSGSLGNGSGEEPALLPLDLGLAFAGFVPHAPIIISSDQDFINQGWPGSGTAANPYRIENLEIVSQTGNCIDIRSTTVHFRVRQCSLTGGSPGCGIYLEGIVNGILEDNTCTLGACGIRAYNSQASQIVHNTCLMTIDGIRLVFCQTINVTDNVCQLISGTGIRLYESERNSVARNRCEEGLCGIAIYGGNANDVSENTCVGNSVAGLLLNATLMTSATLNYCNWNAIGIYVQDTTSGSLMQNTCDGNNDSGAFMMRSHSNNLVGNLFRDNSRGVDLASSTSNYIAGNLLEDNTESGVHLYLSPSNRIDGNTISGSMYGIYAVASNYGAMTINKLSNNTQEGILLVESEMNTIDYNAFMGCGLELQGESHLAQQDVSENTVNGAPLVYLQNQRGPDVPSGAGQIILLQCRSVTIENQNLSSTSIGLLILQSSMVTIEGCLFAQNARSGVELWRSQTVIFSNNSFIANGECGLLLRSDCSDNSIRENLVANNAVHNAVDDGARNVFDRNFWSDYGGFDTDLDGVGDDPYLISGQAMNRDWNPLMAPPGVPPPARLPRWIITVVTALTANLLVIGVGALVLRYRKAVLKAVGKHNIY